MSLISDIRQTFEPQRPTPTLRERNVQCMGPHGLHRMAYTEWGDRDNPRVVVCAHGLTRNGRDFDDLALAEDFRVICPDVAGRGAATGSA